METGLSFPLMMVLRKEKRSDKRPMQLFCNQAYKTKSTGIAAGAFSAPRNNEILNLWLDFQKVARFIDDNKEWLMPLLERIKEKK